jgi:hypothetical protein
MSDEERQLIGISKIARQKVIERLKTAYASDHLEETDFERRLDLATNTRSREILKELVDDLPEVSESDDSHSNDSLINRGKVKKQDTLFSFFSGVSRKGDWRPAKKIKAVAIMGGIDLDFTETIVPPGGLLIDVFCLMGGVEIRVPEGINVDARPVAFMGGTDQHGVGHYGSDAPTIRVRGFVMMGGVDIKPPPKNYFRKFLKKMFLDE